MPFSPEQLMALKNPYQELKGDQLAEHQSILDNLSADDKQTLADRMVMQCPVSELKNFMHELRAIKSFIPKTTSFYQVIEPLVRIKHVLTNLNNPEINNPQEYLKEHAAVMRQHPGFTKVIIDLHPHLLPPHMNVMEELQKPAKLNPHGIYGQKSTPSSLPDTTPPHSPASK